jgi:hypothetical protein
MLRLLARDGAIWVAVAPELTAEHFTGSGNAERFRVLADAGGDVRSIVAAGDQAIGSDLAALTIEPTDGEPSVAYARDVRARLEEFLLKRRGADLRRSLADLEDEASRGRVFEEIVENDRRLRSLRERAVDGAGQ